MDPQQPNTMQPGNPQPSMTPSEPPKSNKNMLLAVAAVIVVAIIGVVVFMMLGQNKDASNNSNTNNPGSTPTSQAPTQDSGKYQKYSVTDKPSGVTFNVSFYKDAKVEEKNGRTYLNSGEAGSMYSIYLGVATGDKIDCGQSATTTMRLGGESSTVCYKADNTQYAGYAKAKSGYVKINLAGQKAISMEDAKAIMESVTFN